MKSADLASILAAHREWLSDQSTGSCANLSYAVLTRVDLSGADLSLANLSGANLRDTDLSCANLRSANLRDTDLSCANLRSANLRDTNLRCADLTGANLRDTNLWGADLWGADLQDATHNNKTRWPAFWNCPETGSFTAWKRLGSGVIAELEIPAEAKRVSSVIGRKCRAEFARVISLSKGDQASSQYSLGFIYRVGKIVRPDSFDDDFTKECAPGIHFFITRAEAEDYA